MPSQNQSQLSYRRVNDDGEILIVRLVEGVKALVDPIDDDTAVVVPTGRRANLICFRFDGEAAHFGRDTKTVTSRFGNCFGFAAVGDPDVYVLLQELPEDQVVDILPDTEAAAVYAVVPHPIPVLFAAAAADPRYAVVA